MKKSLRLLAMILLISSCMDDNQHPDTARIPEITINEPENGFNLNKMSWLRIEPNVAFGDNATYEWSLEGEAIAETKDLMHVFAEPGDYLLKLTASNETGSSSEEVSVFVGDTTYTNNLTRLIEFLPAPGQFVNKMPQWSEGVSADSVLKTAESLLKNNSIVSLGSFGGYVTMGFDHTVVNREGNDFVVLGNANPSWAEPGIVMVSYDANGNGLADDEWYEIYGSDHSRDGVIKGYEITYFRPSTEPENPNEQNYIAWEDNQGQTGFVPKNSFHRQTYFPGWAEDQITFKGTLIPSNITDQSGNGSFWVNPPYDWGYVDNWPNNSEAGQIDISWARDSEGTPVELKGIDFVKVYSCNLAAGGWLGEVSTEVSGFRDLNIQD
ncbi:PKD-like domain-containing protein [Belliella marina]|uniref:PKD-like domain-containing protein n=1 Tax=Belliella marina TaxID=1644146 RepID=A0ABW4VQJ2_9BACT